MIQEKEGDTGPRPEGDKIRPGRAGGLPGRGGILSGDYIPSMKHRARSRPSM